MQSFRLYLLLVMSDYMYIYMYIPSSQTISNLYNMVLKSFQRHTHEPYWKSKINSYDKKKNSTRTLLSLQNVLITGNYKTIFDCDWVLQLQLVTKYSQLLLLRTPSGLRVSVLNSENLFQSNICNLFLPGIFKTAVHIIRMSVIVRCRKARVDCNGNQLNLALL